MDRIIIICLTISTQIKGRFVPKERILLGGVGIDYSLCLQQSLKVDRSDGIVQSDLRK